MIKYDRKRRDEFFNCSHTDIKCAGEIDTIISYDEIMRCYKCGAFIPHSYGDCDHYYDLSVTKLDGIGDLAPWVDKYQCDSCNTYWGLDSILIESDEEMKAFEQKHNKASDICIKIIHKNPLACYVLEISSFDAYKGYNDNPSLYSGYSVFAVIEYERVIDKSIITDIENKLISEFKEAGMYLDICQDAGGIIYYGIYFDDSGHETEYGRR